MTWRTALLIALLSVVGLRAVSKSTDCITNLGAAAPMPTCTVANPCVNLLASYTGISSITTPQTVPNYCAGTFNGTLYNDGKPTAIDVPGQPTDAGTPTTRYYCKFVPPTASASNRVPLIVFFVGSGGTATAPYRNGIRLWAASGIAGVFGGSPFSVVGLQSLNRHWPSSGAVGPGEDGAKNDFYFRNMSQNDDVRYADAVVDTLVATGVIDRTRIYVMGYSNGAFFSMFYGAVRSGSTDAGQWTVNMTGMTPGGNVIAAAAPFSGADPFHTASCPYSPEGQSRLPVQITVYLCDVVRCSEALEYISTLRTAWQSINATIIPLNADGTVADVSNCNKTGPPGCTSAARQTNHGNFPTWRVTQMIAFLGAFTSADVLPMTAVPTTTTTTTTTAALTTTTTTPRKNTSQPPLFFSGVVNTSIASSQIALQTMIADRLGINSSAVIVDAFAASSGAFTFHLEAALTSVAESLASDLAAAAARLGVNALAAASHTPEAAGGGSGDNVAIPVAIAASVAVVAGVSAAAGVFVFRRRRQRENEIP